MSAIERGTGTTDTERVLTEIAEKSFLDLWTYPNLFRSQKANSTGDGKELCDLLVVCGDDVLIFSDKSIRWNDEKPLDVAWSRWYRKAVDESVKQIRGAERWLRKFPDRVFLDKDCTVPLPLDLPPIERRRVHGVAIVDGAAEACRKHTGSPDGCLLLNSTIQGKAHFDREDANFDPFVIGDVDPEGPFVHVFDHQAIWIVLKLFDTIVDFTTYLEDRAHAIRSKHLHAAFGEDDLAGFYLSRIDDNNRHTFQLPTGESPISILDGTFQDFASRPEFASKIAADDISYLWDSLIGQFTKHILAGTSEIILGEPRTVGEHEEGIRAMALTNRVYRRVMGERIKGAIETSIGRRNFRMARIFIPETDRGTKRCGFIFMVLAIPDDMDHRQDYQSYRELRMALLALYCQVLLVHNPMLDIAVGIGVDAPQPGRTQGGSEDCVTVYQSDLSEAEVGKLIATQEEAGVLPGYRGGGENFTTYEYPAEKQARQTGNPAAETRQQRRQRQRQEAKSGRRA